jgi:hypothetical protein
LDGTLTANLNAGTASTSFVGTYAPSGDWSFEASVAKFDFDALSALYKHMRGGDISKPAQTDVLMGSASLKIDKKAGDKSATFTILLAHLGFDNYGAANASVQVTSSGVLVRAEAGTIAFKEVSLESAYLQVTFAATQGSSISSDVYIGGDIAFQACPGLKFKALAHLYEDAHGALQHTIYGTLDEKSLSLAQLFPKLKGNSFGNITLSDLLFAVASCDDPAASDMNPHKHKISQGKREKIIFRSVYPRHADDIFSF